MTDKKTVKIPFFTEMVHEKLNSTDILVYGAVYFFSFQGEKVFSQSYDTTAGHLGMSKNTVKSALKKLSDLNVITDLTPDRTNAAHEYKPDWIPENGYQDLVSRIERGYQKLVRRVPKIGIQNTNRVPKFGSEKKSFNNSNNGSCANAEENGNKPVAKPRTILSQEFTKLTNIPEPMNKTDKRFWWSSISRIYEIAEKDIDVGKLLMRAAIKDLSGSGMTISDPNSIIKTMRAIKAKGKTNVDLAAKEYQGRISL